MLKAGGAWEEQDLGRGGEPGHKEWRGAVESLASRCGDPPGEVSLRAEGTSLWPGAGARGLGGQASSAGLGRGRSREEREGL